MIVRGNTLWRKARTEYKWFAYAAQSNGGWAALGPRRSTDTAILTSGNLIDPDRRCWKQTLANQI